MVHTKTRLSFASICIACLLVTTACLKKEPAPETNAAATESAAPATSTSPSNPASEASAKEVGSLAAGEASGSFTVKGETIPVRYAYASRGERFGSQSVIVLVTDQPIPGDALAEEFKEQNMLLEEKIRGLEYVFMGESYWVRFHPGQYQESSSLNLKEYTVENNTVRVVDEGGNLSDGKYGRSVRFVAPIR